jgi:nuclease-like protein
MDGPDGIDGGSGAGCAQPIGTTPPQPSQPPELDRGTPGASAAREHERRRRNREARIRRRHPLIGGLLLAIGGAPAHETAWATGGSGEQAVARGLERRVASGPAILLHDRRMPGRCGNIDHLAIAPRAVFVIDTKAIRGRVRVSRPLFGRAKLLVRGRDRTQLVNALDRQVAAVRNALARSGRGDVPVQGAFCFTKAELPLFGSSEIRGHRLCSERSLARRLNAKGTLGDEAIDALARSLASAFPPA